MRWRQNSAVYRHAGERTDASTFVALPNVIAFLCQRHQHSLAIRRYAPVGAFGVKTMEFRNTLTSFGCFQSAVRKTKRLTDVFYAPNSSGREL